MAGYYRNDRPDAPEYARHQEHEKKELGQEHKNRIADASREVRKAWQYDHAQLKASHKAQDQRAYDDTKAKSAEVWQQQVNDLHRSGQDFEHMADRRKDADTRKEFTENSTEEARKASREKIRKRKERKRNRPRRRGDTGRTMDR